MQQLAALPSGAVTAEQTPLATSRSTPCGSCSISLCARTRVSIEDAQHRHPYTHTHLSNPDICAAHLVDVVVQAVRQCPPHT
jgi:hypothetical protein